MFGNFAQEIWYIYAAYTAPRRLFGDLQMNDLGWP